MKLLSCTVHADDSVITDRFLRRCDIILKVVRTCAQHTFQSNQNKIQTLCKYVIIKDLRWYETRLPVQIIDLIMSETENSTDFSAELSLSKLIVISN